MTRQQNVQAAQTDFSASQWAQDTQGPLKDSRLRASFPSHRVAGHPQTRHALLIAPPAPTRPRARARKRGTDGPSFLRAIARELRTQRPESLPILMEEARALLGEAFAAVEGAGAAPR